MQDISHQLLYKCKPFPPSIKEARMQQTWGSLQWLQVMQYFPPSDFVCTPRPQKSLGSIFVSDVLSLAHENAIGMSEHFLSSCQWIIFVRKKSCNIQWKLTQIYMCSQFFDVKRKDFWEMFIHHNTTILLIALSWTAHFTRVTNRKSWQITTQNTTILLIALSHFTRVITHKSWQIITQITTTPQYSSSPSPGPPISPG